MIFVNLLWYQILYKYVTALISVFFSHLIYLFILFYFYLLIFVENIIKLFVTSDSERDLGVVGRFTVKMFALKDHFWPRSFRIGSRYSQKCSLYSQKRRNAHVYLALYLASDFESDRNYFRGFLHRYSVPYFLTRFLTDFFICDTQISTENIYRILIKQAGHNWSILRRK